MRAFAVSNQQLHTMNYAIVSVRQKILLLNIMKMRIQNMLFKNYVYLLFIRHIVISILLIAVVVASIELYSFHKLYTQVDHSIDGYSIETPPTEVP